jgi:hypothetical protein
MIAMNTNSQKQPSLIFLHIPKTAGTTLNRLLDQQYQSGLSWKINCPYPHNLQDELNKISGLQKEEIVFFKGHMPFGLHKLLPQPATYITMLRDPVERVISLYYFILCIPDHYLSNIVRERQMSLKEFITSRISAEVENGQTRLLSGKVELSKNPLLSFEPSSPEWLEAAKKNLKEPFTAFGITERFDESLILFKRKLGWRFPLYVKHNVNNNRPLKETISPDVIRLIEKNNELDIELYNYAKDYFEEQIDQQCSEFEKELRTFKSLNEIYKYYAYFNSYSSNVITKLNSIIRGKALLG